MHNIPHLHHTQRRARPVKSWPEPTVVYRVKRRGRARQWLQLGLVVALLVAALAWSVGRLTRVHSARLVCAQTIEEIIVADRLPCR